MSPTAGGGGQAAPLAGPSSITPFIPNPASLDIPLNFATLKEAHVGTNGKLILHIQDAHANLSGQQSLAKSLEHFLTRYDLKLVLVEGADRAVSLDRVRKLAPLKEWKVIARRMLYEGVISGEEYLNLTTEVPMKLRGVEYRGLYDASVRAYAALVDRRKDILHYLRKAKIAVERLKDRHYPKDLLAYDRLRRTDALGDEDFSGFVGDLLRFADKAGVSLSAADPSSAFPEVLKLKHLMSRENALDLRLTDAEKNRLIERVRALGGSEEAEAFAKAFSGSARQVTQFLAFRRLFEAARSRGVRVEDYPALAAYGEYLEKFLDLRFDRLFLELEKLEDIVWMKLLPDDNARKVRAVDRFLGLLSDAYRLQMSSDHFRLFRFNEKDFPTESWLAFLNRGLVDANLLEDLVPYEKHLEEARADFGRFYRLVARRDGAFVENAGRIMAEEGQDAAVLVAGGYHTAHLTELLRREGYSYLVLTPVVTDTTDHEKYEEILLANLRSQSRKIASARKKDTGARTAQNLGTARIPRGLRFEPAVARLARGQIPAGLAAAMDTRVPELSKEVVSAARLAMNGPMNRRSFLRTATAALAAVAAFTGASSGQAASPSAMEVDPARAYLMNILGPQPAVAYYPSSSRKPLNYTQLLTDASQIRAAGFGAVKIYLSDKDDLDAIARITRQIHEKHGLKTAVVFLHHVPGSVKAHDRTVDKRIARFVNLLGSQEQILIQLGNEDNYYLPGERLGTSPDHLGKTSEEYIAFFDWAAGRIKDELRQKGISGKPVVLGHGFDPLDDGGWLEWAERISKMKNVDGVAANLYLGDPLAYGPALRVLADRLGKRLIVGEFGWSKHNSTPEFQLRMNRLIWREILTAVRSGGCDGGVLFAWRDKAEGDAAPGTPAAFAAYDTAFGIQDPRTGAAPRFDSVELLDSVPAGLIRPRTFDDFWQAADAITAPRSPKEFEEARQYLGRLLDQRHGPAETQGIAKRMAINKAPEGVLTDAAVESYPDLNLAGAAQFYLALSALHNVAFSPQTVTEEQWRLLGQSVADLTGPLALAQIRHGEGNYWSPLEAIHAHLRLRRLDPAAAHAAEGLEPLLRTTGDAVRRLPPRLRLAWEFPLDGLYGFSPLENNRTHYRSLRPALNLGPDISSIRVQIRPSVDAKPFQAELVLYDGSRQVIYRQPVTVSGDDSMTIIVPAAQIKPPKGRPLVIGQIDLRIGAAVGNSSNNMTLSGVPVVQIHRLIRPAGARLAQQLLLDLDWEEFEKELKLLLAGGDEDGAAAMVARRESSIWGDFGRIHPEDIDGRSRIYSDWIQRVVWVVWRHTLESQGLSDQNRLVPMAYGALGLNELMPGMPIKLSFKDTEDAKSAEEVSADLKNGAAQTLKILGRLFGNKRIGFKAGMPPDIWRRVDLEQALSPIRTFRLPGHRAQSSAEDEALTRRVRIDFDMLMSLRSLADPRTNAEVEAFRLALLNELGREHVVRYLLLEWNGLINRMTGHKSLMGQHENIWSVIHKRAPFFNSQNSMLLLYDHARVLNNVLDDSVPTPPQAKRSADWIRWLLLQSYILRCRMNGADHFTQLFQQSDFKLDLIHQRDLAESLSSLAGPSWIDNVEHHAPKFQTPQARMDLATVGMMREYYGQADHIANWSMSLLSRQPVFSAGRRRVKRGTLSSAIKKIPAGFDVVIRSGGAVLESAQISAINADVPIMEIAFRPDVGQGIPLSSGPGDIMNLLTASAQSGIPLSASVQQHIVELGDAFREAYWRDASFAQKARQSFNAIMDSRTNISDIMWLIYRSGLLLVLIEDFRRIRHNAQLDDVHELATVDHVMTAFQVNERLIDAEPDAAVRPSGISVFDSRIRSWIVQPENQPYRVASRWATLLHDIGKPERMNPPNIRHDDVGAYQLAPRIMKVFGLPNTLRPLVSWLVANDSLLSAHRTASIVMFSPEGEHRIAPSAMAEIENALNGPFPRWTSGLLRLTHRKSREARMNLILLLSHVDSSATNAGARDQSGMLLDQAGQLLLDTIVNPGIDLSGRIADARDQLTLRITEHLSRQSEPLPAIPSDFIGRYLEGLPLPVWAGRPVHELALEVLTAWRMSRNTDEPVAVVLHAPSLNGFGDSGKGNVSSETPIKIMVFVKQDRPGLLRQIIGAMSAFGIDIQHSFITTSRDPGFAVVLDQVTASYRGRPDFLDGIPVTREELRHRLEGAIRRLITSEISIEHLFADNGASYKINPGSFEFGIAKQSSRPGADEIRIKTSDRSNVLLFECLILSEVFKLNIQDADIVTVGDASNIFWIDPIDAETKEKMRAGFDWLNERMGSSANATEPITNMGAIIGDMKAYLDLDPLAASAARLADEKLFEIEWLASFIEERLILSAKAGESRELTRQIASGVARWIADNGWIRQTLPLKNPPTDQDAAYRVWIAKGGPEGQDEAAMEQDFAIGSWVAGTLIPWAHTTAHEMIGQVEAYGRDYPDDVARTLLNDPMTHLFSLIDNIVKSKLTWTNWDNQLGREETEQLMRSAGSVRKAVIIEDDESVRETMVEFVKAAFKLVGPEGSNAQMLVFASAQEAEKALKSGTLAGVNLIVTDRETGPGLSGWQFLEKWNAAGMPPAVQIIYSGDPQKVMTHIRMPELLRTVFIIQKPDSPFQKLLALSDRWRGIVSSDESREAQPATTGARLAAIAAAAGGDFEGLPLNYRAGMSHLTQHILNNIATVLPIAQMVRASTSDDHASAMDDRQIIALLEEGLHRLIDFHEALDTRKHRDFFYDKNQDMVVTVGLSPVQNPSDLSGTFKKVDTAQIRADFNFDSWRSVLSDRIKDYRAALTVLEDGIETADQTKTEIGKSLFGLLKLDTPSVVESVRLLEADKKAMLRYREILAEIENRSKIQGDFGDFLIEILADREAISRQTPAQVAEEVIRASIRSGEIDGNMRHVIDWVHPAGINPDEAQPDDGTTPRDMWDTFIRGRLGWWILFISPDMRMEEIMKILETSGAREEIKRHSREIFALVYLRYGAKALFSTHSDPPIAARLATSGGLDIIDPWPLLPPGVRFERPAIGGGSVDPARLPAYVSSALIEEVTARTSEHTIESATRELMTAWSGMRKAGGQGLPQVREVIVTFTADVLPSAGEVTAEQLEQLEQAATLLAKVGIWAQFEGEKFEKLNPSLPVDPDLRRAVVSSDVARLAVGQGGALVREGQLAHVVLMAIFMAILLNTEKDSASLAAVQDRLTPAFGLLFDGRQIPPNILRIMGLIENGLQKEVLSQYRALGAGLSAFVEGIRDSIRAAAQSA